MRDRVASTLFYLAAFLIFLSYVFMWCVEYNRQNDIEVFFSQQTQVIKKYGYMRKEYLRYQKLSKETGRDIEMLYNQLYSLEDKFNE